MSKNKTDFRGQDNTIIATAIPKITSIFNSLGDMGWYGSSYLLTTTALQPSFGRIYTYFNVKYTYVFVLLLFEVGSVLCAVAKNSTMLIIGSSCGRCWRLSNLLDWYD